VFRASGDSFHPPADELHVDPFRNTKRWLCRCVSGLFHPRPDEIEIDFRELTEHGLDVTSVVRICNGPPQTLYTSSAVVEVLGWTVEELSKMSRWELYPPESITIIEADIQKLKRGSTSSMVLVEAMRKDGRPVWLENKSCVLRTGPDGEMLVMLSMRDVTRRKQLEDQLSQMALMDGLTGVANRWRFDETLEREWKRTCATRKPLSLILVDVDCFKAFNDTYGHLVGDACLRSVARVAREVACRPADLVARYGGDELTVVLPATSMTDAEEMAGEICKCVAALQIPHQSNSKRGGVVTVSCGVSTGACRDPQMSMCEDLLLAADAALYKVKERGRNGVAAARLPASPGTDRTLCAEVKMC
jgi:diguanylate cyclase (GGDEF)-like protein/PAS domain S-box-containing protein